MNKENLSYMQSFLNFVKIINNNGDILHSNP